VEAKVIWKIVNLVIVFIVASVAASGLLFIYRRLAAILVKRGVKESTIDRVTGLLDFLAAALFIAFWDVILPSNLPMRPYIAGTIVFLCTLACAIHTKYLIPK